MGDQRSASSAELERMVAEARAEVAAAHAHQAALAQILHIIAEGSDDPMQTLGAIAEGAATLCRAFDAVIFLRRGEVLVFGAHHGPIPVDFTEFPITRTWTTGRAVVDRATIHVRDLQSEDQDFPDGAAMARRLGHRTILGAPLISKGEAIGAITVRRTTVSPFSEAEIALLATFADQAAIAIENLRNLTELREALDQQTALADVLKVISRTRGDLAPVFDAVLKNATRICGATFGNLALVEGDAMRHVASCGSPPEWVEMRQRDPILHPGSRTALGRVLATKRYVHVPDAMTDDAYREGDPLRLKTVDQFGVRTILCVPMIKDDAMVGAITIVHRDEVRPFTEKQIALLSSFAAQAAIAVENARLLSEVQSRTQELTEALERQTATSQVLGAISTSQGELEPVFQTMLENAMRICDAKFGILFEFAEGAYRTLSMRGIPAGFVDFHKEPRVWGPNTGLGRLARTRQTIHVHDTLADPAYAERDSGRMAALELGGVRTFVAVPMLKDATLTGAIVIFRQEVRPFSPNQIELVTGFAGQAVVAIENARLLTELRESLERQTATSEVLNVISRSAFDITKVFEAVAESAVRLCEADKAFIFRFDGDLLRAAVSLNASERLMKYVRDNPIRPGRYSATARAALERRVVHIEDVSIDAEYSYGARDVDPLRTNLAVPMMNGDTLLGVITIYRLEVKPFTASQIALLETFADQAAIAIQNARLLTELRESLERQTATSEVLNVISRSTFDLQPVLDAIVNTAARLCHAEWAVIFRRIDSDKTVYRAVSSSPGKEQIQRFFFENPIAPGRRSVTGRAILTRAAVHVHDVLADPEYEISEGQRLGGYRTVLSVPLTRQDEVIGAVSLQRDVVRPFNAAEIELVTTFADQAVIAIENSRLLTELRDSLDRQTATSEVLTAISRSTFDLPTVLRTLVEAAARLCRADQGTIAREQGGIYRRVASHGFSGEFDSIVRDLPVAPDRGSATGRALYEGRIVHIPDVEADPEYTFDAAKRLGGFRTILAVPMLREGVGIGVLALTRREPRAFTEKEIELVSTFADQAAIAIENVRLFESAEARSRELAQSLADLQKAQARLVQAEKMASLGQLTAGIAHEIKNPLNFVNNFAKLSDELLAELAALLEGPIQALPQEIRDDAEDLLATVRENLGKINQHGARADSIVRNMLAHSRAGPGEKRMASLNSIAEEALNLAYHGARAATPDVNVEMRRSLDPEVGEVECFPQDMMRVLVNLITNGMYAASERARVSGGAAPEIAVITRADGARVEVEVRDNGTGIPPDLREKVFEPFFTTKPAGEGTGLGLSLSYDIVVKQHGGELTVESDPGVFTAFRVSLPRAIPSEGKPQ